MNERNLRERIAGEAARLLLTGQERDVVQAKRKAARILGVRFRPRQLPSNREIRTQLERIGHLVALPTLRLDERTRELLALRWMRPLAEFDPRLLPGSATPEAVDAGVHLRIDDGELAEIVDRLLAEGAALTDLIEPSREGRPAVLRLEAELPVEIDVWAGDRPTNGAAEPNGELTLDDLHDRLLAERSPDELDDELAGLDPEADRFEAFRYLLERIEGVRLDPTLHPEGDALFHGLQVFALAREERPYDEEFLTAALLHAVGKVDSPRAGGAASAALLEGLVTHRTAWLIENLDDAMLWRQGSLPPAGRHRLQASPDVEDVQLLADLDAAGRVPGADVPEIDEALDYLARLEDGSLFDELG